MVSTSTVGLYGLRGCCYNKCVSVCCNLGGMGGFVHVFTLTECSPCWLQPSTTRMLASLDPPPRLRGASCSYSVWYMFGVAHSALLKKKLSEKLPSAA